MQDWIMVSSGKADKEKCHINILLITIGFSTNLHLLSRDNFHHIWIHLQKNNLMSVKLVGKRKLERQRSLQTSRHNPEYNTNNLCVLVIGKLISIPTTTLLINNNQSIKFVRSRNPSSVCAHAFNIQQVHLTVLHSDDQTLWP